MAAAGFLSLVSSMSQPLAQRLAVLRRLLPLAVPQAAGALAALAGIALLVLARGIRRGQRRAFLVCQATLVAVAVLHLVRAVDVVSAAVALGVVGFLWLNRASFKAGSDNPPLWRGLATLAAVAALAVVAAAFALEGSYKLSVVVRHRAAGISWGQAFLATIERMGGVRHVPLPDRLDDFFSPAMFAVTAGLVLVAVWMVFRPVVGHWPRPGGGLERAREVVRRHGSGTLDYFALRSDKQFFFWGGTVVAYAVYSGTCLVSPDPVGPVVERERAWRAFRDFADARKVGPLRCWGRGRIGSRSTGRPACTISTSATRRSSGPSASSWREAGSRASARRSEG